jgi:hypothetical protein
MGEGRGVYRVLVGRPESKRPLGRTRRRWEDNIKLDLREIGIDGARVANITFCSRLDILQLIEWKGYVKFGRIPK